MRDGNQVMSVSGRVLLVVFVMVVPRIAVADAVIVTRAMKASTILEASVEEGALLVELEIGNKELEKFPALVEAATGADGLPASIPVTSGLSFKADGTRLRGTIERAERRKRVERDEVSGEPLPTPRADEVLFVVLRYPLRAQPRTLVLSPPTGTIGAANTAPTASNVSITGTLSIGQTLTGSYTYTDADGDLEGNSTFRWLRNGIAIPGAVTRTYVLVAADVGQPLIFEVTPVALSGILLGTAVQSGSVSPDNVAPVITGQVVLTTAEDFPLTITLANLTVTDPDNSFPTGFTLTVLPGTNYSVVGSTVTPALDFSGVLSVPVTVNDGIDDSAVFNLSVTVTAANDVPVIIGQQALSTLEDTSLTIVITDLTVVDPDNIFPDDFTLFAQDGLSYTRSENTITPAQDFSGTLSVPVAVNDGMLTSALFMLQVTVSAENDAPTLVTPILDQQAVENTAYSFNVSTHFLDPDNPMLTYTAIGLPISGNISFDTITGIFSGTPIESDAQDFPFEVTVTASDGLLSISDIFSLTVSALDRANVSLQVTAAPDPAMLADEVQFNFVVSSAGPTAATGVALTGSFIGDGLTVAPSGVTTCTVQAPVGQVTNFSCQIGDLLVGASTSLSISATSSNPGAVTVAATAAVVAAVPVDPNIEDNSVQTAIGVATSFSNGAVQILGNAQILSVAVGDVNGDLAADIVLGTGAGQPLQIFLSDGFRDFSTAPITVADNSAHQGVALADFDNNGTLDMVLANAGVPDTVYSNDGAGNFTLLATLPGATLSNDVGVGDFNGDNFMDVVFAAEGGNLVFHGNGAGAFALSAILGTADSRAVAVGLIDNNNRPDVVFANVGGPSSLWNNVGFAANATPSRTFAIGDASSVVIAELLGGINANAMDVAFGRIPSALGDIPGNIVLTNNGAGILAPSAPLGMAPTNDILAGDVNRDGLNDLVFVNATGVHQIWIRTGSTFVLHSEQIVAGDALSGVVAELGMTDVGEAGGVDLAMGGAPIPGAGVYLNDSFGNLGRGDAVVPELVLNGDNPMSVPSNSPFIDPRATATDNIDGDISTSVVATGVVNTALVGSYTVTYDVTDFAGNAATPVSRTVNVTPAVGTGGGGGGSLSPLTVMLALALLFAIRRRNRIRFVAV